MGEYDRNVLTVEQALERILATCQPVAGSETVALVDALDRVLATPVAARINVPPAANSAMDGYALRASAGQQGIRLRMVGVAAAGHPWDGVLGADECVRILTGAVLPTGGETVVMQEDVQVADNHIVLQVDSPPGNNIRGIGEDTAIGQEILPAGRRLGAADIGVLATQGIAAVNVLRRPRVAFFTTGDELAPLGQPLQTGQIYDSNRYTLQALLQRYPVLFEDLGVIPDTAADVRDALRQASQQADLVLTTGGVSVGDADYVSQILQAEGKVGFWKIAMKPGRPLAFGRFGPALFLGLPGNPVSVMATFSIFVRPALLSLCGSQPNPPLVLQAQLTEEVRKRPGRTDYQRGIITRRADGVWEARSTGGQGSHQLSSMSKANAYIILPRDSAGAQVGDWVEVMPFETVF